MILDALISQIEQRFQHEKRARVCLWFDEREEFGRIIPLLESHLAKHPMAPFVLLAYDVEGRHGQIWLKHQVHRRLARAPSTDRKSLRFVIYVPLPEDRLDSSDQGDEARLDLLEEYRAVGTFFRIGGKRPTLFSFLKQTGVPLPNSPSDQRRLYDGGRNSLLAKYTAKFIDRPAEFWEATLTPDVAQSRLIDDVDQTIFEIAADPEGAWNTLRQNGLDSEFIVMIKERYGFDVTDRSPSDWMRDLVRMVALTETFLAYREPVDFPLLNRLPPLSLRSHHVTLVHRWLRDGEFRPAWDRWIADAEEDIDLTAWAKERTGLSVAFPHLVSQRWQRIWLEFETASSKGSTTEAFFSKNRNTIAEQAEFLKASHHVLGEWQLLRDLGDLVVTCRSAGDQTDAATTAKELVAIYIENARRIEGAHLQIRHLAETAGLAAVTKVADRSYATYTNALNDALFERISKSGTLDVLGIPGVTAHLEQFLWKARGRRAVIIVDALRYDCAIAIGDLLRGQTVDVTPVLATLPTITPIGMTALLPLSGASISVEIKNNYLHPKVNGRDTSARENRLSYLRDFGADCRDIGEIEATSEAPESGELLVVFGHEEMDHMGHGHAQTLVRHLYLETERLARLVRKLHRWRYAHVHIVTDHGFILLDEEKLPNEVLCDPLSCRVLKERFAIVPSKADVRLATLPFAWDSEIRVAIPPGLAFFKAEKSFSHGGAAVQELVIPHLVSREQVTQAKRLGVEVVLPTFELQRPAVKITLRAAAPPVQQEAQMALFAETGRTLSVEVFRHDAAGAPTSVLAGKATEVRLEPGDKERSVTLFFHTATVFRKGELLELSIRDVETTEQFPPGGIKLTVGRDM
jgi:hypothetical protein